jgi:hypothetical protein
MGSQYGRLAPQAPLVANLPTSERSLTVSHSPLNDTSFEPASVIGRAVPMSLGTVALFAITIGSLDWLLEAHRLRQQAMQALLMRPRINHCAT